MIIKALSWYKARPCLKSKQTEERREENQTKKEQSEA